MISKILNKTFINYIWVVENNYETIFFFQSIVVVVCIFVLFVMSFNYNLVHPFILFNIEPLYGTLCNTFGFNFKEHDRKIHIINESVKFCSIINSNFNQMKLNFFRLRIQKKRYYYFFLLLAGTSTFFVSSKVCIQCNWFQMKIFILIFILNIRSVEKCILSVNININ